MAPFAIRQALDYTQGAFWRSRPERNRPNMLRQKAFYSGNVQGVGFRHAVASLASQFPVEGYVRNLPDGRVELAVQGKAPDVRALLAKIQLGTPGSISATQLHDWTDPLTSPGFQVRFDLNP